MMKINGAQLGHIFKVYQLFHGPGLPEWPWEDPKDGENIVSLLSPEVKVGLPWE